MTVVVVTRYSALINETLMATLLSIPLWVHLAVIGLWSPQLIWFHRWSNKVLKYSGEFNLARMLKGSLKLIKDAKERSNKAVVGISQEKEKEDNEDEEEVEEAGVNEEIPATDDVAMDLNHQRGEADKSLQKKLD